MENTSPVEKILNYYASMFKDVYVDDSVYVGGFSFTFKAEDFKDANSYAVTCKRYARKHLDFKPFFHLADNEDGTYTFSTEGFS